MGIAPARAQAKLTPVRFTCGANLGYANIFVADSAGIFRKYGIEPQVILFDVGFLGTEAVLAGQAETSTTVAFPIINYVAKGADLICPAVTVTGDDLKIVALTTIAKPEDFVGKKVGLIIGSTAQYALDRYLQHFNVPKDKVQLINIPAAEQVALMAKGDIDAFVWADPVVSRGIEVMKGKAHVMAPGIEVATRTRSYLQIKKTWAEANPDMVLGILRAHVEAAEFIKKNSAATAQIVGNRLNLPPAQIPDMLMRSGYRFDVYLEAAQLAELKSVSDWMRDNKRLTAEPGDLRRILAPEYLRKVAPASVVGL
jgi:NitT/TauT family transport system substrate-binding protein